MIKLAAEDKSMKESDAEIPTCGVKLARARSAMGAGGKYMPGAGKDTHCGIQHRLTFLNFDESAIPSSKDIWKEFGQCLRNVVGHNNRQDFLGQEEP